jgi:hypothetical protein
VTICDFDIRTGLSDIVRPVTSLQLTKEPDRVRSFGGLSAGLSANR